MGIRAWTDRLDEATMTSRGDDPLPARMMRWRNVIEAPRMGGDAGLTPEDLHHRRRQELDLQRAHGEHDP